MNVTNYIFKSPYPSPVQVGQPDTSSQKNQGTQKDSSAEIISATNETLKSAQTFESSQIQEVKPSVVSSDTLDTYA